MVVKVDDLLSMDEFKKMNKDILVSKLQAVESLIRSYTNNNFQNRTMRIEAASQDGVLMGSSPYFKTGDTVQISQ